MAVTLDVAGLREAGVPLGPLDTSLSMFKTRTGQLLHADATCSPRHQFNPVTVQLAAVDASSLCDRCCKTLPDPSLESYRVVAHDLASLHRKTVSGLLSFENFTTLLVSVAEVEERLVKLGPSELSASADAIIAAAKAAAAELVPSDQLERVLRRCAVSQRYRTHDTDVFKACPSLDLDGSPRVSFWHSCWESWSAAVLADGFDAARVALRRTVLDRIGARPTSTRQLAGFDFGGLPSGSSFDDWVAQRWEAYCVADADRVADAWRTEIEADIAAARTGPLTMFAFSNTRLSSNQVSLLTPFRSVTAPDGSWLLAVAPAPVITEVLAQPATGSRDRYYVSEPEARRRERQRCEVPAGVDAAQLCSVVVGLWDPTSELSFSAAVDAASLIAADQSFAANAA